MLTPLILQAPWPLSNDIEGCQNRQIKWHKEHVLYRHCSACSDGLQQGCAFLQAVANQDVVHFDLKCDNILLEASPGVSEEQFWQPTTNMPPFKVVLADFGDSCDFSLSDQKFTTK